MNCRLLFLLSITTLSLSAMLPDAEGNMELNGKKFFLFHYLTTSAETDPNKKLMDFFRYDPATKNIAPVGEAKDIDTKLDNQNLENLFKNIFIYAPNYNKKRCAIIVGTMDTSLTKFLPKH